MAQESPTSWINRMLSGWSPNAPVTSGVSPMSNMGHAGQRLMIPTMNGSLAPQPAPQAAPGSPDPITGTTPHGMAGLGQFARSAYDAYQGAPQGATGGNPFVNGAPPMQNMQLGMPNSSVSPMNTMGVPQGNPFVNGAPPMQNLQMPTQAMPQGSQAMASAPIPMPPPRPMAAGGGGVMPQAPQASTGSNPYGFADSPAYMGQGSTQMSAADLFKKLFGG